MSWCILMLGNYGHWTIFFSYFDQFGPFWAHKKVGCFRVIPKMTHFLLKTCYLMYLEGFKGKNNVFFSALIFCLWVSDGLEHIFRTKWLRMSAMVLFCSFFNYLSNDPLESGSNLGICPLKSNRSSWLPSTKKHLNIWWHLGAFGVSRCDPGWQKKP